MNKIEYHTDGSPWIACTKSRPLKLRTLKLDGQLCSVYHPKARQIETDNYGSDSLMECPFCETRWWIERDG